MLESEFKNLCNAVTNREPEIESQLIVRSKNRASKFADLFLEQTTFN